MLCWGSGPAITRVCAAQQAVLTSTACPSYAHAGRTCMVQMIFILRKQQLQANRYGAKRVHVSFFGSPHVHALLDGAGDLDAPTLSYAFHTAFVPAGTMLRVTASDLDLLGCHVLVWPQFMLASHSMHSSTEHQGCP